MFDASRSGPELLLRAGDSRYSDVGSIQAERNAGGEPAVVLVATTFGAGEQPVQLGGLLFREPAPSSQTQRGGYGSYGTSYGAYPPQGGYGSAAEVTNGSEVVATPDLRAVPTAPAPDGLASVALPDDAAGIEALFRRFPTELVSTGDGMPWFEVAIDDFGVGYRNGQGGDATARVMAFDTTNVGTPDHWIAEHVIAATLGSGPSTAEVRTTGGHDGALYWVRVAAPGGSGTGADAGRRHSLTWGQTGGHWSFFADAPTSEHLDAPVAAAGNAPDETICRAPSSPGVDGGVGMLQPRAWRAPATRKESSMVQEIGRRPDYEQRIEMTYEEWWAWPGEITQAEWVDGVGIIFPPQTTVHAFTKGFVACLVAGYADLFDLGVVFMAPLEMRLSSRSSREPDVLFIARGARARITDLRLEGPADLVVEIVDDDSVERDRVEKMAEYAAAGIPEYWIVDPRDDQRQTAFYHLTERGEFAASALDAYGRYHSRVLPGFWLRPAWFWQEPRPHTLTMLAAIAPEVLSTVSAATEPARRVDVTGE